MGDHVFLKVMPNRGVVRFVKQGKLSPRYIGPFEVLERVGMIAYRLAVTPSLSVGGNTKLIGWRYRQAYRLALPPSLSVGVTAKLIGWRYRQAYLLALPPSLSGVHTIFHVFMLWKYTPDPTHVVD